jgi:hypothetical protein
MPHDPDTRQFAQGVGWSFGILAAILVVILIAWGWGGPGRGWGRGNQLAHMAPPAFSPGDGPATRTGAATLPPNGR